MEIRLKTDVLPRKDDKGKLDYTLLDDMPNAIRAVVEVMQWAITEKSDPYERGSFLYVHPTRYLSAMHRHYWQTTEDRRALDEESQKLHLAHMAVSALMALEMYMRGVD
jgi:hypothetical protein